MPTSQTACTCHSLDKSCQRKGSGALRSLVTHSSFSDKVPNCLGLHSSAELEDHSWQDPGQCCCPFSGFFSGHQRSGNPLVNSTVTNSLLLLFLLLFLQRENARVGRERGTYYKGGSILFCRAWFVITLAIKRKTMFVYCCFYSISSSSGTGRAAFSKKEFFAAVLLMSISAFEYIKFSVE